MLLRGPAADLARRQLDHERGRAGHGVVHPARGASRVARKLGEGHADELRVEALEGEVAAGLVDDAEGLVVPDDEPWLDALEEGMARR